MFRLLNSTSLLHITYVPTATAAAAAAGTAAPLPQGPPMGACGDDTNCISVGAWLKSLGNSVQKDILLPVLTPKTDAFFALVDDPILNFIETSDITNRANDVKAFLLPIQDLESLVAPVAIPIDDIFTGAFDSLAQAIEPMLKVSDQLYPQPLTAEELEYANYRAIGIAQCDDAGFPLNADATFTLPKPDPLPSALPGPGEIPYNVLFGRKLAGAKAPTPLPKYPLPPLEVPLPCSQLDVLLKPREPVRLTADEIKPEMDWAQRYLYNERWHVEDDSYLDYSDRQKAAKKVKEDKAGEDGYAAKSVEDGYAAKSGEDGYAAKSGEDGYAAKNVSTELSKVANASKAAEDDYVAKNVFTELSKVANASKAAEDDYVAKNVFTELSKVAKQYTESEATNNGFLDYPKVAKAAKEETESAGSRQNIEGIIKSVAGNWLSLATGTLRGN